MRSSSPLIALTFLAGLGLGFIIRPVAMGTPQQRDTHTADRAAIERLNHDDIEVTLSQDAKGLADIWSDDGIRLTPGGPPTVGKQAIAAENEKFHALYPEFKVLKYAPDLKNFQIAIVQNWAIEVGSMEAIYKLSENAEPVSMKDTGMRLLKRQRDGSWKFFMVGLK